VLSGTGLGSREQERIALHSCATATQLVEQRGGGDLGKEWVSTCLKPAVGPKQSSGPAPASIAGYHERGVYQNERASKQRCAGFYRQGVS